MKPNRSDVNLTEEAAAKVEAATREYFDGLEPQRHTKPDRSEYSSTYTDAAVSLSSTSDAIPEFLQFQILEKDDTQKLVTNGTKVADEFTETEYYRDLNYVDKQHHTTGTGFIRVDSTKGKSFSLTADSSATETRHALCRGNPATNDWIPATADMIDFLSAKPNRSES